MNKYRILLPAVSGLIVVSFLFGACASETNLTPTLPPNSPPSATTPASSNVSIPTFTSQLQEDSSIMAEELVRASDTFAFDGMEETLKLVKIDTGATPVIWTFTFDFQSRHAGYGDRTGQILAQVITPHRVVVTVTQGDITSAIMDGQYDLLG